ncbi:MAG: poly(3-hydroxybutyrate) depolymerase [Methylocella sp.]
MGISVSRQTAALIATVLILAVGLLVFSAPSRPNVAAAGPDSGIAAACSPGSRTGHADLDTNLQTSDRLTIAVRTPSDYDPTRAYPLLVVFPPAGFNRRRSETFYGLTTEATRRGFIVAYSDHIGLSPTAVLHQAKVAATVASFFCVDEASIAYLGHSDGGSMAEGIPAYVPKASAAPHSIVASAAGITGEDLATMACPSIPAVMIVHSRTDERFPGFGRGAAAYWGRCAACAPADLNLLADGCRDFSGCSGGRRVTYCETSLPHKRWPSMNTAMLDFIQGGKAKAP